MRRLIAALAVLVFLSVASAATKAAQSDLRVILIGTGIPVPDADRSGPATLVEAGEQKLLFDAGRGYDAPLVAA